MKLVIEKRTATVFLMYPDTATLALDETGLTINSEPKHTKYTSTEYLLIEDVTAEAFLLNVTNQIWKYNI
tara:strand:- start:131 stop:340 length:210 start_codon:yes stop_codon:yes gene_type:complete